MVAVAEAIIAEVERSSSAGNAELGEFPFLVCGVPNAQWSNMN
jgi:hypothetical protein